MTDSRGIAGVLGIGNATVHRDINAVSNGTDEADNSTSSNDPDGEPVSNGTAVPNPIAATRKARESQRALDALDRVMQRPAHRPAGSSDNVTTSDPNPRGQSEAYALRRLRKERRDLHDGGLAPRD